MGSNSITVYRAIYLAPQPGEEWAEEYAEITSITFNNSGEAIQELVSAVEHEYGGEENAFWNYFEDAETARSWIRSVRVFSGDDKPLNIHSE
tara:strand:- start:258 stop:533 length:276 start_codon:yes stop_codon:yes gene_type:complete